MNIEYRTILETAGYADWSDRGRVALEGPDSASFLQALVTNDLTPLTPRQGVYALYLTPQGRMIADLEIHDLGTSVLCEVAPGLASSLATRLDQLIFAENTRVTDVSAEHAEICILGGQAARRVEVLFGLSRESLEQLPELARIEIAGGFVTRSGESTLPSYRVFVPAAEGQAVIERLESLGTPLMSASLLQALRIANARAAWGSELGEQTIPLEAGLLERAISTSKGCYVGQEVIIRILHRGGGRVAKKLVQLTSHAMPGVPERGAVLVDVSGAEVGATTSVSPALEGDGWIALAYLSRETAEVGRDIRVQSSGDAAQVTMMAR